MMSKALEAEPDGEAQEADDQVGSLANRDGHDMTIQGFLHYINTAMIVWTSAPRICVPFARCFHGAAIACHPCTKGTVSETT